MAQLVIDAGVVTGATSVTSTAFVGDITGDVTGTADVLLLQQQLRLLITKTQTKTMQLSLLLVAM